MKNTAFEAAANKYAAPMKFKNESAFTKAGGDAARLTEAAPAANPAPTSAPPEPDDDDLDYWMDAPEPAASPKASEASPMFGLGENQKRLNKPDPAQRKSKEARSAENALKPSFREAVDIAGQEAGPSLSEQMKQTADEIEADEAEAAWDALPEHQSNLDDDREFEKMKARGESPGEHHLPPHQTDVNDPINQQLQAVGALDATPEQIMQFAEMLGIPAPADVDSPRLLAIAIAQHGAGDALVQIMEKHGLQPQMVAPPRAIPPVAGNTGQPAVQPMPRKSGSEKAGSMAGDFVSGFVDKSPIGVGRRAASKLARKATGNRFSAAEKEQPGIAMPTGEIDNEDAKGGDQLGLFEGTGKKKKLATKYKQDNPQGKATGKTLFDKNEDPDQKTLFGSFGEAVEYYAADVKKK